MSTTQTNVAYPFSVLPADSPAEAEPYDQGNLAAIFAGADVGLALFDSELRVLACNALYRVLCGYHLEEVVSGRPLSELMRISLRRQQLPEDEIEGRIERALDRLEPGTSYAFRYTSPSACVVEVRRRRLPNGTLVETVREVEPSVEEVDGQSQFARFADAARVRMMHALEVMADGFALYDAQDRLVVCNRKYVEFKSAIANIITPGITYEEMLREAVRRGCFNLNGTPEEDYSAWRLHQHRNPGEPYEMQLSDGRWVQVSEQRTYDGGIVGIRSDITELKQRELAMLRISQQLHARNLQFDTALNNMVQGLCLFDKEQVLIVCNRRYLEIYGFSDAVVKSGITLRELMEYSVSLGNYTQEEAARALAERNDPERLSQRVTIKQRLKDGRVIAVMNEPMADGGSIATYQDITEAERSTEQMADYTLKLERSNRELVDFAYVASHDLQEPLRKIEAFGDRLMRRYAGQLPDDGRMFIDRMQNAAGRMRQLINDLLSYSRVTTNAHPFASVDLGRVLTEVLSDLQIRVEENQATIDCDRLPTIEADPVQMRQLLQNLLGNALKFRKSKVAPRVEVRAQVEPSDRPDQPGRVLRLTIRDNGIGFDNKYSDQIFTIFQRLHGRHEYEGTGVGLATVRKIVERHQGTIHAEGRPDDGATFTVRLPMVRDKKARA